MPLPETAASLEKQQIDALIVNSVPEGRRIDYKQALPGNSDSERKEFLADISALANSAGGWLLYGIEERRENGRPNGIPEGAPGLGMNADAEILRLESMIRDGLAPRLQGVWMRPVTGFDQGAVLVVYVPRSWAGPHMMTFKGSSRFFGRSSAGKFQLDVDEIRAAFSQSEALPERIRTIRAERIAIIAGGETPVALGFPSLMALHLIPRQAVSGSPTALPLDGLTAASGGLAPLRSDGFERRHNFDGFLTWSSLGKSPPYSYVQLFRSGIIEAVCTIPGYQDHALQPAAFEDVVNRGTLSYLQFLRRWGQLPPVAILATCLGVSGFKLDLPPHFTSFHEPVKISRDVLLLPPAVCESYEDSLDTVLRPVFDTLWQTFGFEKCPHYRPDGTWSLQ